MNTLMPALSLSLEQEAAIELVCDTSHRIASVTGNAGTGKTTIMRVAYDELIDRNDVALCAPTGRAAKRIHEATGIEAVTIHKLLGFPTPREVQEENAKGELKTKLVPGKPRYDRFNPLPYQVVMIDEASMIGEQLFNDLMAAIPPGGLVRFFGDIDQLPPVEYGKQRFKDMLEKRPAHVLTYNFRSGNVIIDNSQRIIKGRIPQQGHGFDIVYTSDPAAALREFVTSEFTSPDNVIITPGRRAKMGTLTLNTSIQMKLNNTGPALALDRLDPDEASIYVRANDKFIWTKNDYQFNIFNGEMGTIASLDREHGELTLLLNGEEALIPPRAAFYHMTKECEVPYDPRKQIDLGYVITTHKSQGSQFDHVVYVVKGTQPFLLNRKNFYTAITRAKHKVTIITDTRGINLSTRPPMPPRARTKG